MLQALDAPELVFGICSPVGTDNNLVFRLVSETLSVFDYKSHHVKVTSLMKELILPPAKLKEIGLPEGGISEKPFHTRYDHYIKYANEVRRIFEDNSILAKLCCAATRNIRSRNGGDPAGYTPKVAYVFDQFKRTEEIKLLRQVYGRLFILISVYSDPKRRADFIADRISSDRAGGRVSGDDKTQAEKLIARDEAEEDLNNGQKLRDAFSLADVFINLDDRDGAEKILKRFLNAMFGSNATSPTRDEYGMYAAKSASLRSVDLSRQVGAAIFSCETEVIALGCNEVPKANGGTYWAEEADDARDFKRGKDENERIKRAVLLDTIKKLRDAGFITEHLEDQEMADQVIEKTADKDNALHDTQIMDLLEFGRIIHAEMSAICDAARIGRPVKGAILYSTTFPCHLCAKHIVASGIKKVIYIEPYPKSYAEHLHSDSIVVGLSSGERNKVQFSPFIGISPYRYRDLFERGKRKDKYGKFSDWIDGSPMLIVKYNIANWLNNEVAVTSDVEKKTVALAEKGLLRLPSAESSDAEGG